MPEIKCTLHSPARRGPEPLYPVVPVITHKLCSAGPWDCPSLCPFNMPNLFPTLGVLNSYFLCLRVFSAVIPEQILSCHSGHWLKSPSERPSHLKAFFRKMDRSERSGLLISFNTAEASTAGCDGLPDVTQQEVSVMPGEHNHGKTLSRSFRRLRGKYIKW